MPADHPLIIPPEKPKVLIVGAGLSGIMLAILLEKAGVPYQVYDRMTEIKPLGNKSIEHLDLQPEFLVAKKIRYQSMPLPLHHSFIR